MASIHHSVTEKSQAFKIGLTNTNGYIPDEVKQAGLQAMHRRPMVSHGKQPNKPFKSWRTDSVLAWGFSELQIGDCGSSYAALVFDCDSLQAQMNIHTGYAPLPNWITTRRENNHAHAVYCLDAPIHKYSTAHIKPLEYLADIAEFLTFALCADHSFRGCLTHNPLRPTRRAKDQYETQYLTNRAYTLDDLNKAKPHNWQKPPRQMLISTLGRNCTITAELLRWCGYARHLDIPVLAQAELLNARFDDPLPLHEIQATARKLEEYRAKWLANGWHKPEFLARQKQRNERSIESRRKANQERNERIIELSNLGMKTGRIAVSYGLNRRTIQRILNG